MVGVLQVVASLGILVVALGPIIGPMMARDRAANSRPVAGGESLETQTSEREVMARDRVLLQIQLGVSIALLLFGSIGWKLPAATAALVLIAIACARLQLLEQITGRRDR